jgi:hypothetical protein
MFDHSPVINIRQSKGSDFRLAESHKICAFLSTSKNGGRLFSRDETSQHSESFCELLMDLVERRPNPSSSRQSSLFVQPGRGPNQRKNKSNSNQVTNPLRVMSLVPFEVRTASVSDKVRYLRSCESFAGLQRAGYPESSSKHARSCPKAPYPPANTSDRRQR